MQFAREWIPISDQPKQIIITSNENNESWQQGLINFDQVDTVTWLVINELKPASLHLDRCQLKLKLNRRRQEERDKSTLIFYRKYTIGVYWIRTILGWRYTHSWFSDQKKWISLEDSDLMELIPSSSDTTSRSVSCDVSGAVSSSSPFFTTGDSSLLNRTIPTTIVAKQQEKHSSYNRRTESGS